MKKQLLAFLSSTPLAIEKGWLQALIDIIQSVGDTKRIDSEMLNSLVVNPGQPFSETSRATVRGDVGIVALDGPIFPKPNILTEWLGIGTPLDRFMADMHSLYNDHSIESILIAVDSPGGSVTGINEAASLLTMWGKEKPIITYTGGANCSAAYWLTSAAGKIYADATARVGSIGVVATCFKNDIEDKVEIVNSKSPKKALSVETKEGQEEILKTVNAIADVFIASVATHRGVSEDVVTSDFGQGGVLVGQEAVSVKMIDDLSSFEKVLSKYSTEESLTTHYVLKGESDMELTLEMLKAKFPAIYQAACAEATAPLQATITERNTRITGLEEQIVTLEGKLETAGSENATLATRVTALEREGEIQKAKNAEAVLKAKAAQVSTTVLGASDLPPRLHSKVSKMVDFNAFVSDKGVLDEAGYKAALETEIGEWTQAIDTTPGHLKLSGLTPQGSSDDSGADDDVVDRMLAHAGVSVK